MLSRPKNICSVEVGVCYIATIEIFGERHVGMRSFYMISAYINVLSLCT